MAATTFTDGVTLIVSAWLNDVDSATYDNFGDGSSYTGRLTIADTTDSTSPTTGSAKTAGGLGVAKAFWGGTTGNFAGALTLQAALIGDATTDSTSITTGAFQTDGGLGVAKALWVGGLANIAGAVTLQSTLTVSGASVVVGGDAVATPLITVNGTDGSDKSYKILSAGVTKWNMYSAATTHALTIASATVTILSSTQAGAVTIPQTLTVTGATTLNGAGTFNQTISCQNIITAASASTGTAVIIDGSNVLRPQTSSERFKDVVQRDWKPSEEQLAAFLLLPGLLFNYKDTPEQVGVKNVLGFSAEELHKAGLSDLLNYDGDGLPFSLREHGFLVYLHAALRQFDARLKGLE